tara:strand:+ start:1029 stop:2084 length:1056 start_codon:yes stop_codon:yes gene_type:complete
MNFNFVILKNEDVNSHLEWEEACVKYGAKYSIIDLTKSDWYENIISHKDASCFLHKSSGEINKFKNLFDERLYVISEILGFMIFPSFKESYIYENKKLLSYFLKASNIPHPNTDIFYDKKEALLSIHKIKFPLIAKTSIGASGTGVQILRNKNDIVRYLNKAFSKNGLKRRFGPNRKTGNISKWTKKAVGNIPGLIKRIKHYFNVYNDGQRGFVIFQEYVQHDFEWRVVKIGNSFFAHKKIKIGEMASGSKGIEYVTPPKKLLNFCKLICEKENFNSMAIDIFEDKYGNYFVNELQTIFGHVQKYILKVDGNMGRYIFKDGDWVFEKGDYNQNLSFNLRLDSVISILNKNS